MYLCFSWLKIWIDIITYLPSLPYLLSSILIPLFLSSIHASRLPSLFISGASYWHISLLHSVHHSRFLVPFLLNVFPLIYSIVPSFLPSYLTLFPSYFPFFFLPFFRPLLCHLSPLASFVFHSFLPSLLYLPYLLSFLLDTLYCQIKWQWLYIV